MLIARSITATRVGAAAVLALALAAPNLSSASGADSVDLGPSTSIVSPIRDFGLRDDTHGWVQTANGVLVTADGGRTFRRSTSEQVERVEAKAVLQVPNLGNGAFSLTTPRETSRGLVMAAARTAEFDGRSRIAFYRSTDDGVTWRTEPGVVEPHVGAGRRVLAAASKNGGWLLVSPDGSLAWQRGARDRLFKMVETVGLPTGVTAIRAGNARTAWALAPCASCAEGTNALYVSRDFGRSWHFHR